MRWVIAFSIVSVLVLTSGCVSRSMTIESEPSGAQISINGKKAGVTPLKYKFEFYGTYIFVLEKEGYRPKKVYQKVAAPLYEKFPIDLFSDVLIPAKIKDNRKYSYKLDKNEKPDVKKLLERAEVMRKDYVRTFIGEPKNKPSEKKAADDKSPKAKNQ